MRVFISSFIQSINVSGTKLCAGDTMENWTRPLVLEVLTDQWRRQTSNSPIYNIRSSSGKSYKEK